MEYIQGTDAFSLSGESAVTLGKFDGLHKGHRLLLDAILAQKKNGLQTVMMTFDHSPKEVFHGEMKKLMPNGERKNFLEQTGLDVLIEVPFVPAFYSLSPEAFVSRILVERLHTKYLAVGQDFRFGKGAAGNVSFLREQAVLRQFIVDPIDIAMCEGLKISSSYAAEMVRTGQMDRAKEHLGYAYRIPVAKPVQESGLLQVKPMEKNKLLPPKGSYPVLLKSQSGVSKQGLLLIGDGEEGYLTFEPKEAIDMSNMTKEQLIVEFMG